MLKKLVPAILAVLPLLAAAQQQQLERRSVSMYERPSYESARIVQFFGREVTETVNLFLKDASLCFLRDGVIYRANVDKVLGVKFRDAEYRNVNGQFGLLLYEKNGVQLIRITTIDLKRLQAENRGDERTEYLEIPDAGLFLKLYDDAARSEDKGYPLMETYYFYIKGQFVPAAEGRLKKFVRPEKKKEFRKLMGEKYWSLKDAECLKQLLEYF